eukprot:13351524-Alexandrium_andersonii.AAC.1
MSDNCFRAMSHMPFCVSSVVPQCLKSGANVDSNGGTLRMSASCPMHARKGDRAAEAQSRKALPAWSNLSKRCQGWSTGSLHQAAKATKRCR